MTSKFSCDCFVDDERAQFSLESWGIQFQLSSPKKIYGYAIKWFYIIGVGLKSDSIDSSDEKCVVLHTTRVFGFGAIGFEDNDPKPDDTHLHSELSVHKYPKLQYRPVLIRFDDVDHASYVLYIIQKRLERLGQIPNAKWRVFLNPFSGSKKARKNWQKHVVPLLEIANINVDLIETQYSGHCAELIEKGDLEGVDLLVSVSGDGLIHEMINGLMRRNDWHRVTQIPIGVIPCGTGNALATSLMFPNIITSVLALLKRVWRPFDLFAMYQYKDNQNNDNQNNDNQQEDISSPKLNAKSPSIKRIENKSKSKQKIEREEYEDNLEQKNQPTNLEKTTGKSDQIASSSDDQAPNQVNASGWNLVCYGFEALMWGIISDVDIESESMRWMGDFRYTIGTLKRIASLRHYPAKLYLLESPERDSQMVTCQFHQLCLNCAKGQNLHHRRSDKLERRYKKKEEKTSSKTDLQEEAPKDDKKKLDKMSSKIQLDEEKDEKIKINQQKLTSPKSPSSRKPTIMKGLARGLKSFINFDPMDPNCEPDPEWKVIDDKFIYFVASNVTHIASDIKVAPYAHASGGTIDVVYAKDIPKTELLDMMSGDLENGKYIGRPAITYEKVRALVLQPTGKPGILDLDGEEYPSIPTALEVHPGVLRVCVAVWNATCDDPLEEFPLKSKKNPKKKKSSKQPTTS